MSSAETKPPRPAATHAVFGGIAFAVVFTLAIHLLAPRLLAFAKPADLGPWWYFWRLETPTALTRLAVWLPYAVHQVLCFVLIARAQRRRPAYSNELHPENVASLVVNGSFAALHLLQTHLTYDGLAQDVHIFSSFGAVAVLLIWVLLMEQPRRGLLFGWKAPVPKSAIDFARRYHAYYFSWAITWTFWFHPAEATAGHLAGFFYTLLLMLQGSLFFTRVHTNRWWTLGLEVLVLVHGVRVALDQGNTLWPMFFFGFAGIFIVTQMHGLGWPRWVRALATLAYLGGIGLVYSTKNFAHLDEPLRIPLIDYLGVAALIPLLLLAAKVVKTIPDERSSH